MRTDEGAMIVAIEQEADFKKVLAAGFGLPVSDDFSSKGVCVRKKGTHSSKSIMLPILSAGVLCGEYNVYVTNISNNHCFYFMGVQLKQAIPATFLWPISQLFGSVPLSGHVTPDTAPFLTNFEKAYHNVERISNVGFSFSHPLHGALVIRYLNELAKLPLDEILNMVLYKTSHGCIDRIDFNAVGGDGEGRLADILGLEYEKFAYYNFDVVNKDDIYERMNVDWYDIDNGGSSVHFTLNRMLPPIPISMRDLLVPTTLALREGGIRGKRSYFKNGFVEKETEIPVFYLKTVECEERWKMRSKLHKACWMVPIDHRDWTINTPNGLDTAMTAFMLNRCLPPVLEGI